MILTSTAGTGTSRWATSSRPTCGRKRSACAARPEAEGVAVGTIARLYRGHTFFDTLAIESVKGTVVPTVVEGRAPVTPTEIMLGTRTLEDLGLDVGDTVRVSVGSRSAQLRIVGRGVLPEGNGDDPVGRRRVDDVRRRSPSGTRRAGRRHARAYPAGSRRSRARKPARSHAFQQYLPSGEAIGPRRSPPGRRAAVDHRRAPRHHGGRDARARALLVGAPTPARPGDLQSARIPAAAGVGGDRLASRGHRGDSGRGRCSARRSRRPSDVAGLRATVWVCPIRP